VGVLKTRGTIAFARIMGGDVVAIDVSHNDIQR
jgi:hypothetical protein